jgi:hypothetical protein
VPFSLFSANVGATALQTRRRCSKSRHHRGVVAANQGTIAIAMALNVVSPAVHRSNVAVPCRQHQENPTKSKVGVISTNQDIITPKFSVIAPSGPTLHRM